MTTTLDVLIEWAFAQPTAGDIGEGQEEREYEPLTAPSVPEPIRTPTPEKVPA